MIAAAAHALIEIIGCMFLLIQLAQERKQKSIIHFIYYLLLFARKMKFGRVESKSKQIGIGVVPLTPNLTRGRRCLQMCQESFSA